MKKKISLEVYLSNSNLSKLSEPTRHMLGLLGVEDASTNDGHRIEIKFNQRVFTYSIPALISKTLFKS